MASAGDTNGDGYDDVVVSALQHDRMTGLARLFLGSAAGLSAAPAWTAEGNEEGEGFGYSVASAGDVDADGFDDVIVGAHQEDSPDTVAQRVGTARVYLGSAAGLSTTPIWRAAGEDFNGCFGGSVASAGDVDGDGVAEVVVGAFQATVDDANEGVVSVYTGVGSDRDGDGVGDTLDVCPDAADPAQLDADADGLGDLCERPRLDVVGDVRPGELVSLVASNLNAGEVVRFGASDALVGQGPCFPALGGLCLDLGRGAIDLGSATASALGVAVEVVRVPAIRPNGVYRAQAVVLRGPGDVDSMKSNAVVFDGDVLDWDADGLTDATELSFGTDPTLADTDGDGLDDGLELPASDPLVPDSDGDGVLDGADVCFAGDDAIDGDLDGIADACDLCPADADPGQADADRDGLGDVCDGPVLLTAGWTAEGNQPDAGFGDSVASAGDVNGDGYDDVIVGGLWVDAGQTDEGRAVVYLGSPAGLAPAPAWSAEGNLPNAFFGDAVASAGDVNGDGYDDVIVGAPGHSGVAADAGAVAVYLGSAVGPSARPDWTAGGGQPGELFGQAVASAGDVNGDGYDDVIVGAWGWDGDLRDEGVARVYLGSAAGLAAAPAWTADGDGLFAWFGYTVASAGDVNGDGNDDVVVGSLMNGHAALYLGSPAGLSPWPEWMSEGQQRTSAASAGDVNGDGYDDVVVGMEEGDHGQLSEGLAEVYLGSPTGLVPVPVWTVEGDQRLAMLGSVAPAGDVNGDGYDDVLVGAKGYSDPESSEGIARVYLGTPTGLGAAPAWQEGADQPGAGFGWSVASAGDVDGDGLSDVLVGAWEFDDGQLDEGEAFLYLGHVP